jgi:hypothetical protein
MFQLRMVRFDLPGQCSQCSRTPIEGLGFRIVNGTPVQYRQCQRCRDLKARYNKSNAGKAASKRYERSEKGRNNVKRYRTSSKGKETAKASKKKPERIAKRKSYETSERGKQLRARRARGPSGKRSRKKQYKKMKENQPRYLSHLIQVKIRKMVGGNESKTASGVIGVDAVTLKAHFETQFEAGMSWENHGIGDSNSNKWHIGHIIARSMYDSSDAEDVKRCWSLKNLKPQWACDNMKLGVALPANTMLETLRDIWPVSWASSLPNASRRIELEKIALGR